jgi:hypothetical protein
MRKKNRIKNFRIDENKENDRLYEIFSFILFFLLKMIYFLN